MIRDLSITLALAGDCDIQVYSAHVNAVADAFVLPIRLGDGSDNELSIEGQFTDDNDDVAGTASVNYVGTLADGTVCNSTGATTWTAMTTRNW